MREIKHIIIHCSATREGKVYHAADIDRWHKARGFAKIGYHFVIALDGTIEHGRALEEIGAHCLGRNSDSIGICYIGGFDANGKPKDTRTAAQRFTLSALLIQLHAAFPQARISGHNEHAKKACPCFDVAEYRKHFGQL